MGVKVSRDSETERLSRGRWRRLACVAVALALVGLTAPGCIDSRCGSRAECPQGKMCNVPTGACIDPECASHSDCDPGNVCQDGFCEPGCLSDDECASNERCVDFRCVEITEACEGPAIDPYCLTDLHPDSPTSGETLCVPHDFEQGTVLFFGSVACGICKVTFEKLYAMVAKLQGEGLAPSVVWMQWQDRLTTSTAVGSSIPDFPVPVLQDTEERDIAGKLGAEWYHVVVVDCDGCLRGHWGPVTGSGWDAAAPELEAAWRDVLVNRCPGGATVVEPEPDAGTTDVPAIEEVLPDPGPEDPGTPDPGPPDPGPPDPGSPDQGLLDPGMLDPGPPDPGADLPPTDGGPDITPDVPADIGPELADIGPSGFCEVTYEEPLTIGAPVPPFVCTDLNPASPGYGTEVTDVTLSELVWIAYSGSCT